MGDGYLNNLENKDQVDAKADMKWILGRENGGETDVGCNADETSRRGILSAWVRNLKPGLDTGATSESKRKN